MSTDLSAPHYVIFSIHPLPRPSQAQIAVFIKNIKLAIAAGQCQ